MGFQDVAFLPSRVSFPSHFLKRVVELRALRPPHVLACLSTVVEDKQGYAPFKILLLQQSLCFVLVKFHRNLKIVTEMR